MVDSPLLAMFFILLLLFLLGSGLWVAMSLLAAAAVGLVMFTSRPAGDAMATIVWSICSSWTLTALPLFIWMGELLSRSRLSAMLLQALAPMARRMPGGLLHVNVAGCTLFAALSGSSAATVATVGRMTVPELRRRGYPERMISGTLAGAGTLGLLIPPSIMLIVYGVATGESIASLFLAGLVPGLVLAAMFMVYVAAWGLWRGSSVARGHAADAAGGGRPAGVALLAAVLLVAAVMGAIYSGMATATEAAALGVAGALGLALWQGADRRELVRGLMGAVRTSAMIAFILAGSACLSLAMGFTGVPRDLAAWVAAMELGRLELIVALTLFYIVLGCFLDGISAIVLTMAVVQQMVRGAGIDMLWFGVFVVLVVEMAQITPPVGFNLFVLRGMTGNSIGFIARAAAPMFLIMLLALAVLVAVPSLATWLPTLAAG